MNFSESDMSRSVRAMGVSFALGALATAAAVHGQARVYYADTHAPSGGTGESWQRAFRDLQDALAAANADPARTSRGVEVRIAQGIYRPDRGLLNPAMYFTLNSGVTLMGGFAGVIGTNPDERDTRRFVSVLSGDLAGNDGPNFTGYEENSRCIVYAGDADVSATLDGVTISGGNADSFSFTSSIIYLGVVSTYPLNANNPFGHLTIRNCDIVRNRAATGPVLEVSGGQVSGCRINDNYAWGRPIVRGWATGLDACELRGNRCSTLGAVNVGVFYAVGLNSPSVRLTRCLFADNLSNAHGMIRTAEPGTNFELINCTIVNNTSGLSEALSNAYGTIKLRNCIIAGNTRYGVPAGVTQVYAGNPFRLDIDNTVLIGNGNAGLSVASGGPALKPVLSGDPGFVAPAGPDGDPATWQDNDYHLRAGSQAIDRAGTADPLFAGAYTDLDGNGLYDDPNSPNLGTGPIFYADIGCYEFTSRLCAADVDGSGVLSAADIFDFLGVWFAGGTGADFDGNGTIAPADIFAFLNAWFAGC